MLLNCPVSLGEVVDKLSILRVKQKNITDKDKLAHVTKEATHLEAILKDHLSEDLQRYLNELIEINSRLWKIEDDIRDKERDKDFGDEFIVLARSVYRVNDQRFGIKNQINSQFGSEIIEVKSYQDY